MKKTFVKLTLPVLLAGLFISASAQNIATVNGKVITTEQFNDLKNQIEKQIGQEIPKDMEDKLKEEIISREIFSQAAVKSGIEKKANFKKQLEMIKQDVLINALFEDFINNIKVNDEEIKAEYDKEIKKLDKYEYKASHILVDSEKEAKEILKSLNSGKKFVDLAKEKSKDTGSGEQGGDLGWASANTYVPDFSKALKKLKKGETTKEAVKSEFGWHIIRLDDKKTAEPPPKLEDIKENIQEMLKGKKLSEYQEKLIKEANVKK